MSHGHCHDLLIDLLKRYLLRLIPETRFTVPKVLVIDMHVVAVLAMKVPISKQLHIGIKAFQMGPPQAPYTVQGVLSVIYLTTTSDTVVYIEVVLFVINLLIILFILHLLLFVLDFD